MGLGMGELIVIFLMVLLLFGAKRLPEIGSALGKGIREFKGSVREIERELKVPDEKPNRPAPPPPVLEENREPRKLTTGDEAGQAKDTKA
jgi:sec-independent protein translocase protein TatA